MITPAHGSLTGGVVSWMTAMADSWFCPLGPLDLKSHGLPGWFATGPAILVSGVDAHSCVDFSLLRFGQGQESNEAIWSKCNDAGRQIRRFTGTEHK